MTRYEMEVRIPGMGVPVRVPIPPGWVEKIRKEHAHELAEKIRNSDELRRFTDDHMADCNAAADLIDPEA
jgi:hypothetical protein